MPDTNHDLDEFMRRSTEVEVPAHVEARLRHRLAEFREKVEHQPPSRLRTLVYSLMHPRSLRVPAMAAAVLVAVALALVLIPSGSNASRAYAAAAAQLRTAQSLEYTIVLAPYTEVDFSYLAPRYRRVNCSWGIELRTDGSGKQMILMPATRNYLIEQVQQVDGLASAMDMVEQFKSLPKTADESLGEERAGGKRLMGYRVHQAAAGSGIPGFKAFDLWVDAGTGNPDHVGITIQEPGKPLYQMQIKDIRVDAEVNRSLFDMIPPAGYTAIATPNAEQHANPQRTKKNPLGPEIKWADALTAVVVPMKGSYPQTRAAVQAVESHLKKMGMTPVGPPFGRNFSEVNGANLRWEVGYPILVGRAVMGDIRLEPPFELRALPAGLAASKVVPGPWGQDSDTHWGSFLRWVVEQGYVPAGPPMEIWSGEDAKQRTQSTEMRIAVTKAN
jgi:outer membrane lipoprotein-sorting protein